MEKLGQHNVDIFQQTFSQNFFVIPLIIGASLKQKLIHKNLVYYLLFFSAANIFQPNLKAERINRQHKNTQPNAIDIILSKRAAITVSATRMYSDSTYTAPTETKFNEGDLFEILSESTIEHSDNTQNQTFKWFRIKTINGEVGWVFGDNLAAIVPEYLTDAPLRPFYKRNSHFDNGFENAVIWIASTDGHDDRYKTQPRLNPAYKEFYLIVTNAQGKSVSVNYANVSETSKRDVISFFLKDVTANGTDELIFETQNFSTNSTTKQRQVEIYSFKPGGLTKIFETRTDLQTANKEMSPSTNQFIDIDSTSIRLSYIDFVNCDHYSVENYKTDIKTRTQEQCLEYVTSTLEWNKRTRNFVKLYPLSRARVTAQVKFNNYLLNAPQENASKSFYLLASKKLTIIKVYDDIILKKNGDKQLQCYFYVVTENNQYGYILANALTITDAEHATLLNTYFSNPPLNISDFRQKENFLRVKN